MTTNGIAHRALVNTEWVAQHVEDPTVRLVEVDRVGTESYLCGHIPGAVGWHWKQQLWDPHDREFPAPDVLAGRLGAAGISRDTTIVVHGDPVQFGTYAWWALTYCGHPDVRLLDGTKTRWIREGRPLTTDVVAPAPVRYEPARRLPSMRILREEVLASLGRSDTILVDLRSPEEYRGERVAPPGMPDDGAERAGHIPGARHLYFSEMLHDDETFRPVDELRALWAARGATPDKHVVVYCRLSHRATLAYFVLTQLLAYPRVRSYDGSWTEWGSVVGVPIAR